ERGQPARAAHAQSVPRVRAAHARLHFGAEVDERRRHDLEGVRSGPGQPHGPAPREAHAPRARAEPARPALRLLLGAKRSPPRPRPRRARREEAGPVTTPISWVRSRKAQGMLAAAAVSAISIWAASGFTREPPPPLPKAPGMEVGEDNVT